MLFSATLSDEVRFLAKTLIADAVEIVIADTGATTPQIDQWLVTVDKANKSALLSHLIKEHQWDQALIFIRTKHGAAKLVSQLEKRGISADAIHGDRSQAMRTQILADFKSGKIPFLVATDIAARGIDIDELSRVVNYDLPDDDDDYIHRIGRTGRAGASGEAVALVSKDDFKRLCAIERRLGHVITRNDIEAFTAKKVVPVSNLNFVPKHKQTSGYHAQEGKSARSSRQGERNAAPKGQQGVAAKRHKRSSDNTASKADNPWGNWKGS